MKKILITKYLLAAFGLACIFISLTDCKKTENPVKFPYGTFPDTVFNISALNSEYDDYNLALYQLYGNMPLIFSSNRKSSGGQFDLEQAAISFTFDQTTGVFGFGAEMTSNSFLSKLISTAQTAGNDFGPYRLFSPLDGFEYLILSSENTGGDLDLFYLKNQPVHGSNLPDVSGPYPVNLLNTDSDDAYITFDSNYDTAYFTTDISGDFDIYLHKRLEDTEISEWFDSSYQPSVKVDSINTIYNDKCPMVFRKVMVFSSDRSGGMGGYDLYYSVFRNGKWNSPVNMGPDINTASNEYRPVLGYHPDFKNLYMMFSSDRPGGKGRFDLYFTGIEFPD